MKTTLANDRRPSLDRTKTQKPISSIQELSNEKSMTSEAESANVKGENVFVKVAELVSGQWFGELALINHKKRSATVKCVTDCHFACIDKHTFELVRKKQVNFIQKRVDIIRNIPGFQKLSRSQLMNMQRYFSDKPCTWSHNQVVVRQGQPITELHLVTEGEFEVCEDHILGEAKKKFDLKEFLAHTRHLYNKNAKTQSFMNSVTSFAKRAPFDAKD